MSGGNAKDLIKDLPIITVGPGHKPLRVEHRPPSGVELPAPVVGSLPVKMKMPPSPEIFQKPMAPHCQGSREAPALRTAR